MATARPTWTRLEALPRDATLATGLRAEVHDPLWLLNRQLALRKLRGTDGGSMVSVAVDGRVGRLTRYAPHLPDGTPGLPFDGRAPLEALVEGEPDRPLRRAARTGLRFLELLDEAGLSRYREAFLAAYPLPTDDGDGRAARFRAVVGDRVPDGIALFDTLVAQLSGPDPRLPDRPTVAAADQGDVLHAWRSYLDWFATSAPPESTPAWQPRRFEYQFCVASPLPRAADDAGEVVLTAEGYDQGRLDWSAFDLAPPGVQLGAADDPGAVGALGRVGLPTPVTYRGMPAREYWRFEDASVDFGDLGTAAGESLTTLFLIGFAIGYANDHFLIPIEVTVGSVGRIDTFTVTDTFGRATSVPHVAAADGTAGRPATFRLFEPTGDARTPLFLVPPTVVQTVESTPVEDVRLLFDEAANLAWAVEAVTDPAGGFPADRAGSAVAEPSPSTGGLRYRLRTSVPETWYPLVPVSDRPGVNHLELGSLQRPDGSEPTPVGRILTELRGVAIPEEEITRAASRVVRTWQYARGVDGGSHLWLGRRREPVEVTGGSGLRFDVTTPP